MQREVMARDGVRLHVREWPADAAMRPTGPILIVVGHDRRGQGKLDEIFNEPEQAEVPSALATRLDKLPAPPTEATP